MIGRLPCKYFVRSSHSLFKADPLHQDIIFACGDVGRVEAILESRGFARGPVGVPSAHTHHIHKEFDATETEVMKA